MEVILETVDGLKVSNCEEDGIRSEVTGGQCKLSIDAFMPTRRDLMFQILDVKNSLKVSVRVLAAVNSGRSDDFPRPRSLSTNSPYRIAYGLLMVFSSTSSHTDGAFALLPVPHHLSRGVVVD